MSKPKMIDRLNKIEKSDKYLGIAIWALVVFQIALTTLVILK